MKKILLAIFVSFISILSFSQTLTAVGPITQVVGDGRPYIYYFTLSNNSSNASIANGSLTVSSSDMSIISSPVSGQNGAVQLSFQGNNLTTNKTINLKISGKYILNGNNAIQYALSPITLTVTVTPKPPTPPPPSKEGTFILDVIPSGTNKLYIYMEGKYRYIYSYAAYKEIFNDDAVLKILTYNNNQAPSPIGDIFTSRTWPADINPIGDAFIATTDTKAYLVETKYVNGIYYYYVRWIYADAFDRYKFSWEHVKYISNLEDLLKSAAVTSGDWVRGPDLK